MAYTSEDVERMKANVLKPDDTFTFTCQMCGNCCRNRAEPILLTGPDIFRIAKSLGTRPGEVVSKYLTGYLGSTSNTPVFVLRERMDGSCSLLRNGKCMVQDDKPVVCAIFPLGRFTDADTMEASYFTQNVSCPGVKKGNEITLKDWLSAFRIEETETMARAWLSLMVGVSSVMANMDRAKITQDMINAMILAMYVGYDTELPYEPQVEQSKQLIAAYMKKVHHIKLKF